MNDILTPRLILRNFREDDYQDLYEFLAQRKNDRFEAYPDITFENGREHLKCRVGNDEFIAVQERKTGKVIGNIYLGNRDFEARELGYIIRKDYQRQGYALEAVQAMLKLCAEQGVHRIFAECDPGNDPSWRLLEKLNFSREALFRKNVYFRKDPDGNPVWQDTLVYSLLLE